VKIPTSEPPEGVHPLCPHCDQPIAGLYQRQLDEGLGKAYVWFCSHCHRTLGMSHRKGFWMG
jgi:hypothetical protein